MMIASAPSLRNPAVIASECLVVIMAAVVPLRAAEEGLTGHWLFDRSHIQDSTVKALVGIHEGRLLGAPRIRGKGEAESLALKGQRDSVLLSDDLSTVKLPSRTLTVEAWVTIARPARWGAIIGVIQDNGGMEQGWLLGYENDHFNFALASKGADDGDGRLTYMQAPTTYRLGCWYHVVGTYDGSAMCLYVNGKLENRSTEQSGDILYPTKGWCEIGAYHDADEYYRLQGRLKEVRVYERALNEGEVAQNFATHEALTKLDPPAGPQIIAGPYLQHVTQNSIVIMWETVLSATSVVEYGKTVPLMQQASSEGVHSLHEVRLGGLQPETGYLYRVRSVSEDEEEVTSETYSFKTAVRSITPFAFAVVGDSRTYPDRFAKVAAQVWGERPDFVLHVGDVVSDGSVKEQWIREYLAPAAPLMRRVPVYIAIGNHERNSHWYYDYVSYPPPENYYSFDYGNAHFAMIDSNQDLSPGSAQYQWLEGDLRKSKARWKFVAHHHPQYSSDSDDYGNTNEGPSALGEANPRKLIPLLEKYRVDIVWYGHIHDYERTYPLRGGKVDFRRGVIYIQTGGGGAELEDFAPTRSWFTAKVKRDWQYCLVTIAGNRLRMMAYDIEGRMYDDLELRKDTRHR